MNQRQLIDYLSELEGLRDNYSMEEPLKEDVTSVREEIEQFKLVVLVIGGFSAGKSALFNTLFDEDLLKESQTPETAIATEIVYAERPFYSYRTLEGKWYDVSSKDELDELARSNVQNIRIGWNHPFLQKHQQVIFVDMPGFNSTEGDHNEAIARYVELGHAYILAVDVEDGDIQQSGTLFIKEVQQYGKNLSVLVTKADKKREEAVNQVVEQVKHTAEVLLGHEVLAQSTSWEDSHVEEKIDRMLETFDHDALMNQAMVPSVERLYLLTELNWKSYVEAHTFNGAELEDQIDQMEWAHKQLIDELQYKREKLSRDLQERDVPQLLNDVQSGLLKESASLARAMMYSKQEFSDRVNSIVRPIIVTKTKQYVNRSFEEYVQSLDLEDNSEKFNVMDSLQFMNRSIRTVENLAKTSKSGKKIFQSIATVLAIGTNVVAPAVELVIVFLPQILKGFGLTQSDEEKQRALVERQLHNEIIPNIADQLEPTIREAYEQIERDAVEQLTNEMEERIEKSKKAMQEVEREVKEGYEQTEERRNEVLEGIEMLRANRKKLVSDMGGTLHE